MVRGVEGGGAEGTRILAMMFTKGGNRYVVTDGGNVLDEETRTRAILTEDDIIRVAGETGLPLDVLRERWKNGDSYKKLIRPLPLAHCEGPSEEWITSDAAAKRIGCSSRALLEALRVHPSLGALIARRSRGRGMAKRVGYLMWCRDVEDLASAYAAIEGVGGAGQYANGVTLALRVLAAARRGKFRGMEREAG